MAAKRWRSSIIWCAASGTCLVMGAVAVHSQEVAKPKTSRSMIVAPPLTQRMTPFTPIDVNPASPDPAAVKETGCVVLGDGRVFQGEITELETGYQVQAKNGAVVLPFTQVRTVAPTLTQAYQQLRESYEQPSASDHLDLGWWCQQNQLFEEASAEAQAALVLEPTREKAVSLLKAAETALGRTEIPETPSSPSVLPRPIAGGAVVSTATQVEFSRHIQRLTLNKCGNGSCHGASALSPLKLQQGVKSDVNLSAILKYVDTENPEQSPLLVRARAADGPHNGVFRGASGTEQYARLLAWVVQAAKDQNNVAGIPKRPKVWREGGPRFTIRPRKSPMEAASGEDQHEPATAATSAPAAGPEIQTIAGEEVAPISRAPRAPRKSPLASETVQELLRDQAPDAFDPEEFNRQVHGNLEP